MQLLMRLMIEGLRHQMLFRKNFMLRYQRFLKDYSLLKESCKKAKEMADKEVDPNIKKSSLILQRLTTGFLNFLQGHFVRV